MLQMPGLPTLAFAAAGTQPPKVGLQARAHGISSGTVQSSQARQLAAWITLTGDHAGAPFIIIDKRRAQLLVFDSDGHLRSHSAVLLGAALGDDTVPGIGTRPIAQILPAERTTPAGRFVAERGRNTDGEDIVWIDYDAAVSMHRLRTGNALERRAHRLATPTIDDNRISYGCINVPVAFYENFIQPIFARSKAVVYVLPDVKAVNEVFDISRTVTSGTGPEIEAVSPQVDDGSLATRSVER
jgi:hypothetical protein